MLWFLAHLNILSLSWSLSSSWSLSLYLSFGCLSIFAEQWWKHQRQYGLPCPQPSILPPVMEKLWLPATNFSWEKSFGEKSQVTWWGSASLIEAEFSRPRWFDQRNHSFKRTGNSSGPNMIYSVEEQIICTANSYFHIDIYVSTSVHTDSEKLEAKMSKLQTCIQVWFGCKCWWPQFDCKCWVVSVGDQGSRREGVGSCLG